MLLGFPWISAPIPGGCNLEFEMPVSPWLRVSYNHSVVNVDHELAALPTNRGDAFPCESESLQYEVFHYYLSQRDFTEDSFFDAIRLLRTVKGAHTYGREVSTACISYFRFNDYSSFLFLFRSTFPRFAPLVLRQQPVHCSVYIQAWARPLSLP